MEFLEFLTWSRHQQRKVIMLLVLHNFSADHASPDPLCSLLSPAVYPGRLTMMCPSTAFLALWLLVGLSQWGAVGCHAWPGCLLGTRGHSSCQAVLTLNHAGSLGSFICSFLPIRPGDSTGPSLLLLIYFSTPSCTVAKLPSI